jgi:phosphoribosylformimino-5-aminoimidazole carboxamide ribotide isomerase
MLIIPAIDLKDGKVVRLHQGRFKQASVYSDNPADTARHWEGQGARYLHVVDLDGARRGEICHLEALKKIVNSVKIPIEFGGGLRGKRSIRQVLDCGVERAVLGSKLQDEDFLRQAFREFKQRVIVSIDARQSVLQLNGWQRGYKNLGILEAAKKLRDIGFRQIIYTDVSRDGTLKGINIAMVKKILKTGKLQLIVSGGISSLQDLRKLKALKSRYLAGAIVGKALYEGRFSLTEALRV